MKKINATDFKARCLAILDDVAHDGETVTITKRGRAVARLVGAGEGGDDRPPQHTLEGTVEFTGDIISPVLPADAWSSQGDAP